MVDKNRPPMNQIVVLKYKLQQHSLFSFLWQLLTRKASTKLFPKNNQNHQLNGLNYSIEKAEKNSVVNANMHTCTSRTSNAGRLAGSSANSSNRL
jgi:hypothetical protein